jgi:O-antigen ligase
MRLTGPIETHRPTIARAPLLVFAFSAWCLTGLANIALALLVLLFLLEVPTNRAELAREPAFLLWIGTFLITAALAMRAALLFPDTAELQLQGFSAWTAPLLFFPVAWWIAKSPRILWDMLAIAPLGLALGVMRRTDWSLLPQVIDGMRYHFGYAALGLAFLASVLLVGLLAMRQRILSVRIGGRAAPALGWALWIAGVLFALGLLIATQSRGAAVILAIAGLLFGLAQMRGWLRGSAPSGTQRRRALVSTAVLLALAMSLLWYTKGRQMEDLAAFRASGSELSYGGSIAIRLNLAEVGFKTFAERPLLGFGPGTSTTEYLVPNRIVEVDAYHLVHAPAASHLHSVPIEILTRFGIVGALIGALLVALLLRAYRQLRSDPQIPADLLAFLALGGVMTLLYCVYDFRLVNLDLRFFFILLFGIVYGLYLASIEASPPRIVRRHDRA